MLRNLLIFVIVVLLMCAPAHSESQEEDAPLYVEATQDLTTWEYEMVDWSSPFVFNNVLWLVYEELTFDNETLLMYRTYDGEWSPPETLADIGELIAVAKDPEALTFFWNTTTILETESIERICFRTFAQEWSTATCVEIEPRFGTQFVVKAPDGETWLLWSRGDSWEYQAFYGDHWGEEEVLATTKGYESILKVLELEDELWIFYETGISDIYYRVLTSEGLSEPQPVITGGFPYLYDVLLIDGKVTAFLEIRETGKEGKTLVYTAYDGEWSAPAALATPQDGFLSGGSTVTLSDGRVFVFWNGTRPQESEEVDIFYRMYDGNWSRMYALTNTPDIWETTSTPVEYSGKLIILWRDKDSHHVYASTVSLEGGGTAAESGELQQVIPEKEPEGPQAKRSPFWRIRKYVFLIPVGGALAVLLGFLYLKRRFSTKEEKKEIKIGERRKKSRGKRK
jgi:hypothetical protein